MPFQENIERCSSIFQDLLITYKKGQEGRVIENKITTKFIHPVT
jgi:hypothetical protein